MRYIIQVLKLFPYDCRSISIILQPSPFFLIYTLSSNLLLLKMVWTRSQLLSKDELNNEVLSLENFKNDVNVKFSKLNDRFNNVEAKYKMVNSNLSITRHCNDLQLERRTQLERNNLNNAQYTGREILEINPVPSDIADNVLEQSVCQALSLNRNISRTGWPASLSPHEKEEWCHRKV